MIDRKALDLVAVAGVAKDAVDGVVVVVVDGKLTAFFALNVESPSSTSIEAAALADDDGDCWYNRGLVIITVVYLLLL